MRSVRRSPYLLIGSALVGCNLSASGLDLSVVDAGHDASASTADAGHPTDASSPPSDSAPLAPETGGQDASATPSEDASQADAAESDDAATDAACPGVMCNGACTDATDCAGCPGATLLCGATGTCTADCSACTTTGGTWPIGCFACDPSGANPVGTCESEDAGGYCLNGDYSRAYKDGGAGARCSCVANGSKATACPGATQVCMHVIGVEQCVTCGEQLPWPDTTDNEACMSPAGTYCNSDTYTCGG